MGKYEPFRVVVAAIIHDGNGRFLLAQRSPKEDSLAGLWSIPAGHVTAGGKTGQPILDALEDNLRREIKEELGIEINIENYVDSHFWIDRHYRKITIVFLCTIASGDPMPLDETEKVGWFTFNETKKLKIVPAVSRLLTKAREVLVKP